MTAVAHVDFCGERHVLDPATPFVVGRNGDLALDDNPYLHRQFLQLSASGGLWWLTNIGSSLTATVSDHDGLMQAWLAPGAGLPLVFHRTRVWFTAGATTYDFECVLDDPPFLAAAAPPVLGAGTTMGRPALTPDQRLLVLALAEPVLRRGERGQGRIPSNGECAQRLGWTLTKFNRKLDNVCQKLARQGVRGLHGDAARLASQRRVRLVEYAVAARLVVRDELELLDPGRGDCSPSTSLPRGTTLPLRSDDLLEGTHVHQA